MNKLLLLFYSSFFLSACSDLLRKETLHQPLDKRELKNIVKPIVEDEKPSVYIRPKIKIEKKIPKKLLKPVSVSLNGTTSLKDVFLALADQANIELQLDPAIKGDVIYTAYKKPFYDVVKTICKLAKLRFTQEDESIRIELDMPYSKNYNLPCLNIERHSQNRISTATDVFNSVNVGMGQNKGNDNSSNSEVKVTAKNSFWEEFEENLKTILQNEDDIQARYAIHRQAGLISVHGTQVQHELVQDYITRIKHITSRQVLIEAKIVEVNLKDNFKSGIDWRTFNKNFGFDVEAKFGALSKEAIYSDAQFSNKNGVAIGGVGGQFSGILKALEEFGSSRTLSSPRLTVMNNQIAILKVAQNKVYFKLNYDKQFSTNNNFQNFSLSSDIQTVPIGLVMSVQPSIDEETGDIILCLRPTISKLATTQADPAVDIALANAQAGQAHKIDAKPSLIPVIDVKEIDSVLRVKSGEIAVLGGLMEVRTTNDSAGLPGLKDIPLAKDLFSAQSDTGEVVESVILLRATIVDQPEMHVADKRLLSDYVVDTRG